MGKKNNINISGGIDVAAALNHENQRIDGRKFDELRLHLILLHPPKGQF